MKGMATVRLLRELERHTGRRTHELFDLIGAPAPCGCAVSGARVHGRPLAAAELVP